MHSQVHMHACMHADIQTYRHTDMHACSIQTYRHTDIHTYIHPSIHPSIHPYIHTYILHYIYIYTDKQYTHLFVQTFKQESAFRNQHVSTLLSTFLWGHPQFGYLFRVLSCLDCTPLSTTVHFTSVVLPFNRKQMTWAAELERSAMFILMKCSS